MNHSDSSEMQTYSSSDTHTGKWGIHRTTHADSSRTTHTACQRTQHSISENTAYQIGIHRTPFRQTPHSIMENHAHPTDVICGAARRTTIWKRLSFTIRKAAFYHARSCFSLYKTLLLSMQDAASYITGSSPLEKHRLLWISLSKCKKLYILTENPTNSSGFWNKICIYKQLTKLHLFT